MSLQIHSFGGDTCAHLAYNADGHLFEVTVERVVWFDRDIDGRWLVWATGPEGAAQQVNGPGATGAGALVVRDPAVIAFIEHLGQLIATPQRFADEPTIGA